MYGICDSIGSTTGDNHRSGKISNHRNPVFTIDKWEFYPRVIKHDNGNPPQNIWRFPEMGGTPKSSILMGC